MNPKSGGHWRYGPIIPTIAASFTSRHRTMFKIRTYNTISVKGLDRYSRERYEVASELPSPDAFMIRSQKLHDMEFPESLMAIGRAGAGVNNVPLDRCNEQGIVVFNAPGANANAVKANVF